VAYKFTATSNTGAILILPSGAALSELQNKRDLDVFWDVATKCALPWCKFAGRDSLYLLTGVYTTSSWTLASFYKGWDGGEIRVAHHHEKPGPETKTYKWRSQFEADFQPGPNNNRYENQTVLIKGFKMTVRWAGKLTVVEHVAGWQSTFASFGATLLALLMMIVSMSQSWLPRSTSKFS